jgi:hypothetical protein
MYKAMKYVSSQNIDSFVMELLIYYCHLYCHVYGCLSMTYRRVLDWLIGFIDTLFTPVGTAGTTAL